MQVIGIYHLSSNKISTCVRNSQMFINQVHLMGEEYLLVVVGHLDIYMQNNVIGWALSYIRYKKENKN